MLALVSCSLYGNDYPIYQTDTKWECTDPKITYRVDSKGQGIGVYQVQDHAVYFGFGFQGSTADGVEYILDDDGNFVETGHVLFFGTGKFGNKNFCIKINSDPKNIFGNQYEELIFTRVD